MSENAVAVTGLRKAYRELLAVDGVSFTVERGEIFGIVGPNGSGKTTTVECLQGLRDADAGDIHVLGLDPRIEGEELRRRIGCQLQESALPERLRVWEALDLFATLSPTARDWEGLAREWGIYERRDSAFAHLSGGERQRLFVALALVNDPELVFLDEMTTGLDPAARRVAWSLIGRVRDRGATVVLITHFMDEAERLCDRIAVFKQGSIVDTGSPADLIGKHGGESTVHFTAQVEDDAWMGSLPGVRSVEHEGSKFRVRGSGPVLAHVAAGLVARGVAPPDLRVDLPTFEDVYLRIVEDGAGQ